MYTLRVEAVFRHVDEASAACDDITAILNLSGAVRSKVGVTKDEKWEALAAWMEGPEMTGATQLLAAKERTLYIIERPKDTEPGRAVYLTRGGFFHWRGVGGPEGSKHFMVVDGPLSATLLQRVIEECDPTLGEEEVMRRLRNNLAALTA